MRMGKSSRVAVAGVGLILASGVFWPGAYAQNAASPKQEEAPVQLVQPTGPNQQTPPITVTLKDALDRARKLDPATASAEGDQKSAREDRLQARNALLPQVTVTSQFLNTQGNGITTDGRFVTNDGIHVYREWAVLHQDLSPASLVRTGYHRAE